MTTVKDLKQWLNNFPDETIVEFAIQQEPTGYESYGQVNFINPKLKEDYEEGWEFVDFRNNRFVKEEAEYFGKCYLKIGEGR